MRYHWPGNIRELINAFEYAFVVCRTNCIEVANLPETIACSARGQREIHLIRAPGESELVMNALRQSQGKKMEAARLLGISRQALWKKMVKLGIKHDFSTKS